MADLVAAFGRRLGRLPHILSQLGAACGRGWLLLVPIALLGLPSEAAAEAEGFCTMCHKYPGLGRLQPLPKDPERVVPRVFYINDELFDASYHGKVRCKNCHTGVDIFPHVEPGSVDCAADCHIVDPSSNKPFSHRKIVADFDQSVHGKYGSRAAHTGDLPVCKDCHRNKPYHASVEERIGASVFLNVCKECHQSEAFAERFYEHMIYRTTKRRPSREVVRLCSTCHADEQLMAQHDLDVVVGFSATFHAKAITFGDEEVANCLNCHAPYQLGFSPHRITSWRENRSPVSPDNKIQTCRQAGCHSEAIETFAAGSRVHPSPRQARSLIPSLQEVGWDQLTGDSEFHEVVINWIRLFYKVLIIVVVGGLGGHWLLTIYASRRMRTGGGH